MMGGIVNLIFIHWIKSATQNFSSEKQIVKIKKNVPQNPIDFCLKEPVKSSQAGSVTHTSFSCQWVGLHFQKHVYTCDNINTVCTYERIVSHTQHLHRHTHQHMHTHTLSARLCCRSSSTCGYYRSHLSLALCFIPLLPHWRADRFYSSLVPGEPQRHTHTHMYMHSPCAISLSSIYTHTYFCREIPAHLNKSQRDVGNTNGQSGDVCVTIIYDS